MQREIEQQILPDGGHISRDPGAIIDILLEFLPLRQAFTARNIAPPQALSNAIDRMMPMLRFFRHSEGTFAHFNGMGATPADHILTLLAYDDNRGAPLSNAPYSAYQRLEANGGVVIMDTGRAPPIEMSLDAHAGCLSFEFSTPKQSLIVVNCGMPSSGRENWRQLARSTAAHSTVTFNDTSSARFVELAMFRRLLGGSPLLGGPRAVSVTREDAIDAIALRATHDGYADRFGIVHERTLMLAADGTRHRRRRHLPRRRRRHAASAPRRTIRHPLSPASRGEGDPAHRRPRRHADDAEQGGLDLHAPDEDRWSWKTASISPATKARAAPRRSSSTATPAPPAGAVELAARQSAGATTRRVREQEEPRLPL